jgi:Family of unknown function (DUF6345)
MKNKTSFFMAVEIRERLSFTFLFSFFLFFTLFGSTYSASAQANNQLPVYVVNQFGATPTQARLLADAFNISPAQIALSNGLAFFMSPSNYLAVPSIPVVDPTALSILLHETENENPAIPIQVQQIDFNNLGKLTVLDSATAIQVTSNALAGAGLNPQYGVPVVGHTMFTAFYSNEDNTLNSNSVPLDTEVDYQFTLPGGYSLEGPGAQVQFSFGATGRPTRILYAAPQLSSGPSVTIIPIADAIRRAADLMDPMHKLGSLNLSGTTVYQLPHCIPCVAGPIYVLPWVKVEGFVLVTNPYTGDISQLDLMPQYVPDTDDPAFVPQVNLMASSVGNTQVVANVTVTGGTGPYSYVWSGSSPSLAGFSGPSIGYNPIIRLTPPPLELEMVPALHSVLVHWWAPDPSPWANGQVVNPWVLESTSGLSQGANDWTPVRDPVQTSNGVSSVLVNLASPQQFFRLRLAIQSVQTIETVQVSITDANGVTVPAVQTVPVQAMVVASALAGAGGGPGPQISGVVDWGTESPYDPGLGANDRSDWRLGMAVGGGGTERFLWTGNWSWKEDFIDAPSGINNLEVDNADITLYIGHGNPTVFTFTGGPGPDPSNLFYNEARRSWGNNDEEWLCLLSCEVLQDDWNGLKAWQRWGQNFDGLHGLYGFHTLAYAGTGFPFSFAQNMSGWPFISPWGSPMTILNAWFSAAHSRGTGTPAAMGPIGPGGAMDAGDYYWGKGPVGPTIRASQIHGWWYMSY